MIIFLTFSSVLLVHIVCSCILRKSVLFLMQVESYLKIISEPKLPSLFLQVDFVFRLLHVPCFIHMESLLLTFGFNFRSFLGSWENTAQLTGSILPPILVGSCAMWQMRTQAMKLLR